MIVACPGCSARYQIESGRLRPEGVRLRCSRCEAVFRVSPPPTAAETAAASPPAAIPLAPMPPPEAPKGPAPSLPPPMSRGASPVDASPPIDRERVILIADPEVEQGKLTAGALAQWGLQPTLVHDGVEAILAIQRLLPRAIVIDAALPKMFGFQICEIVKRNESLRDIHVVLVGAIHDRTRYRRPPEEFYGADAYVERQDLPESLRSILQGFGMLGPVVQRPSISAGAAIPSTPSAAAAAPADVSAVATSAPEIAPAIATSAPEIAPAVATPAAEIEPATATPAPESAAAVATPAPVPAPAVKAMPVAEISAAPKIDKPIGSTEPPVAPPTPERVVPPTPESRDPGIDEKVEQAERLARIVVSDIVLYSKEKFEAAVQTGNVLEAMQPEIAEGRSLFAARVDASIQEMRDFLAEELLRVAEAKGKS